VIDSNKKKEKDDLIIIPLLLEIKNSRQNQIRAMITIYREEMPNPKLDYFARKNLNTFSHFGGLK